MKIDWIHDVPEQLDWLSRTQARPRLDGLSHEEYLWEPAPGAWPVRRTGERNELDWASPTPDPAPVTTIAWRLGHVTPSVTSAPGRPSTSAVRRSPGTTTASPFDAATALNEVPA